LLHAATLGFLHPISGKQLDFTAPMPPDMLAALQELAPAHC
jgi:23S rRNA pseudouridine1911/1915/1917 synthase